VPVKMMIPNEPEVYEAGSRPHAYADANYAREPTTRKSDDTKELTNCRYGHVRNRRANQNIRQGEVPIL
jgi:hypothetical protein